MTMPFSPALSNLPPNQGTGVLNQVGQTVVSSEGAVLGAPVGGAAGGSVLRVCRPAFCMILEQLTLTAHHAVSAQ
jgi:hypothetical protein